MHTHTHKFTQCYTVLQSSDSLRDFQMTAQEVRLCGLLLREHFGEVVEKVGVHLLRSGTLSLRALAHETSTSTDLVTLEFASHVSLVYQCRFVQLFFESRLFYITPLWFFWTRPAQFTDQAHLAYSLMLCQG